MKEYRSNLLICYSKMATFFLFIHQGATGSVVVTDIDPDTVINLDGELYLLDMDNNSVSDFIIFKDSGYYYYEGYSSTTLRFRQLVAIGPQYSFENKILGALYYNSWSGSEFYMPFPLYEGELISSGLNFYNYPVQIICAGHLENIGSGSGFNLGPGYWLAPGNHGVENRYLGVSFIDAADNRYYGWARCSTADSMKAITIHEYAYENIPNKPIVAGDTVSYLPVTELNKVDNISIWNYGSTIYFKNPDNTSMDFHVVNSSGSVVFKATINTYYGSIDLGNQPHGFYLLVFESNGKSIKVVL